jgi:DNA-directed RNA polymerase specialized sigma subunit
MQTTQPRSRASGFKKITARFGRQCSLCHDWIHEGQCFRWNPKTRRSACITCIPTKGSKLSPYNGETDADGNLKLFTQQEIDLRWNELVAIVKEGLGRKPPDVLEREHAERQRQRELELEKRSQEAKRHAREGEKSRQEAERRARESGDGDWFASLIQELEARKTGEYTGQTEQSTASVPTTTPKPTSSSPQKKSDTALLDEWVGERNALDEARERWLQKHPPTRHRRGTREYRRQQRRDQEDRIREWLKQTGDDTEGGGGHARDISLSLNVLLVSTESEKVTPYALSHSKIARLAGDNPFLRMLKEHANKAVNRSSHLTDSKDGDDLIQVGLLEVVRSRDGYRGESQFLTYAETVIKRAMSGYAKQTKPKLPQRELPEERELLLQETAAMFGDPHDILEQKESIKALLHGTKDADLLLLHAMGYPDAELGPPYLVKVKRHRAKKKLREKLLEEPVTASK